MANKDSYFDRFYKAIFGEPAQEPGSSRVELFPSPNTRIQDSLFLTWFNEAFATNQTVQGALQLIANAVCETPIIVRDREGNTLPNADLAKLFRHINPRETTMQFLKRLVFHMYLGDQCFIEKVRARNGKVTELGLLRPDYIAVTYDEVKRQAVYTYELHGKKPIVYSAQDIVHITFASPESALVGYSPLKSLAKIIETDNIMNAHMMYLFQNRGTPGVVFKHEDILGEDQKRAMLMAFNQGFKDKNMGKALLLDGGMSLEQFGYNLKDLEFNEVIKSVESRILAVLRVPPVVYGSLSGQDNSTYDNMRSANKQFWQQCIIPLQSIILDAINDDVELTNQGQLVVEFDRREVEALQEDTNEKAVRLSALYQNNVMTLNEVREMLDLDPVDGGDEFNADKATARQASLTQSTNQPGDTTNNPGDQPQPPVKSTEEEALDYKEIDAADLIDLIDNRIAAHHNLRSLMSRKDPFDDQEWDELLEGVETGLESHNEESEGDHKAEELNEGREPLNGLESKILSDSILKQVTAVTRQHNIADKYVVEFARIADKIVSNHIRDAKKMIGAKYKTSFKSFDINKVHSDIQAYETEWLDDIVELSTPALVALYREAAEDAAASLNYSYSIDNSKIIDAIRADQLRFAKSVTGTSRQQLRELFERAYQEGKTVGQIAKELTELNSEWTKSRAMTIARTETTNFTSAGTVAGFEEAGVEYMMWSAILDSRTTPICQELDGKVVGIKAADGFARGYEFAYYGGIIKKPPAHANCRSGLVAVDTPDRGDVAEYRNDSSNKLSIKEANAYGETKLDIQVPQVEQPVTDHKCDTCEEES